MYLYSIILICINGKKRLIKVCICVYIYVYIYTVYTSVILQLVLEKIVTRFLWGKCSFLRYALKHTTLRSFPWATQSFGCQDEAVKLSSKKMTKAVSMGLKKDVSHISKGLFAESNRSKQGIEVAKFPNVFMKFQVVSIQEKSHSIQSTFKPRFPGHR